MPAALILLVSVPMAAGTVRLTQLIGGAAITPGNARFFASPAPIVIHIVCAGIYSLLGAFQFVPGFRARRPRWHRVAGRLVVVSGLAVAFSGMWMTLFYPLPEHDGELLAVFRYVASSAIAGSIVLGLIAVRRRDFAGHRAWMIRGYAIALGAGTQVLTTLPWLLIVGEQPSRFPRALLLGAGWLINIVFAEWRIRPGQQAGSVGA